MIRVLVVEDTPVVREMMVNLLKSDPKIEVIGVATNGEEAISMVAQLKPDVVTMDLHMPKLDGLEATRAIMERSPTPIVVVSGSSRNKDASWAFSVIEAGALAVQERPHGLDHPDYKRSADDLLLTVRLMSEVKVVRRWNRKPRLVNAPAKTEVPASQPGVAARVVAIGASTGGPMVLQRIFSTLPSDLAVPILVVQHISPGFGTGMVDWLAQSSAMPISVAEHGLLAAPGNVYVAKDGYHLGIDRECRLHLSTEAPENGHRPSVSYLFRSVAQAFGARSVGVLLTGMGKDGAAELTSLKKQGAITIVQDKESCIVNGMPGEAVEMGGACFVMPPDKIAATLVALVNDKGRVVHE